MTTLRDRRAYRHAVLRCLYGAMERNRPEVSGTVKLRQVSEQIVDWLHSEQMSDETRAALDKALATVRSI
ncbi:hypothetical protein ACI2LV_09080 [Streptomyces fungicidicus]|jgi:hypothetical protein|uniref:hypothetical protein n=1 Tax=Streptomyces fungicidicus TaxID=68203 RepID=UPI0033D2EFCD